MRESTSGIRKALRQINGQQSHIQTLMEVGGGVPCDISKPMGIKAG